MDGVVTGHTNPWPNPNVCTSAMGSTSPETSANVPLPWGPHLLLLPGEGPAWPAWLATQPAAACSFPAVQERWGRVLSPDLVNPVPLSSCCPGNVFEAEVQGPPASTFPASQGLTRKAVMEKSSLFHGSHSPDPPVPGSGVPTVPKEIAMAKRMEVCEGQYLQTHPETWQRGWGSCHHTNY